MPPLSGNGIRGLVGFLSVLGASIVHSVVDPPVAQPPLTIVLVWETSSAIILSLLGWASKLVLVDVRTKMVYVRSGACEFTASVVCSNQPVLAVDILHQSRHTDEIEWTSVLVNWTPSDVRWISYGSPVRYHIPQPVGRRYYRVRDSNTPPRVAPTVAPLAALPGVTNPVVISVNSTYAVVVLDGTQSSDPDNDQAGGGRESLIAQVRLMGVDPGPHGARPSLASLKAAAASFDRGNLTSGGNQLQPFQHQVWARLVSFNQGNTILIQAAEEIIRAVRH